MIATLLPIHDNFEQKFNSKITVIKYELLIMKDLYSHHLFAIYLTTIHLLLSKICKGALKYVCKILCIFNTLQSYKNEA